MVEVFLGNRGLGAVMSILHGSQRCVLARFVMHAGLFHVLSRASITFMGRRQDRVEHGNLFLRLVQFLQVPCLHARGLNLFVLRGTDDPYQGAFATSAFPMRFRLMRITILRNLFQRVSFPIAHLTRAFRARDQFLLPTVRVTCRMSFHHVQHPFARNPSLIDTIRAGVRISNDGVQRHLLSCRFLFFFRRVLVATISDVNM